MEETRRTDDVPLRPETLATGHGYDPRRAAGSAKPPIYQTSTFVFDSAAAGKRFFEIAQGECDPTEADGDAMIYSRLDNPDLRILEQRLVVWDGAEESAVFASGMAAIATTLLAHLRPGDILLHSHPLYGGTDHLVRTVLPRFGIRPVGFGPGGGEAAAASALDDALADGGDGPLGMVLIETPANPTLDHVDIEPIADLAARRSRSGRKAPLAVDNTFLGPLFQHPLDHGADLVLYSATKYIGGHSDLIAGVAMGGRDLMAPIRELRTYLGTMATPFTAWLLMRSLETLQVRMTRQAETARRIASFLAEHPAVVRVAYPELLNAGDPQHEIYKRQCLGPGAMIAFEVEGGEKGAFRFLDGLDIVKLAVSLGGTESLIEHPATTTHACVDPADLLRLGITPGLVRLSVGLEHPDDLIRDLSAALNQV